jgi:S1-C subfamily serine protease
MHNRLSMSPFAEHAIYLPIRSFNETNGISWTFNPQYQSGPFVNKDFQVVGMNYL